MQFKSKVAAPSWGAATRLDSYNDAFTLAATSAETQVVQISSYERRNSIAASEPCD